MYLSMGRKRVQGSDQEPVLLLARFDVRLDVLGNIRIGWLPLSRTDFAASASVVGVFVFVAFHIYDFILLFGPIMAWWTFPFERLIGALQKFNTNDHVGGELEGTIVRSFWKGANL